MKSSTSKLLLMLFFVIQTAWGIAQPVVQLPSEQTLEQINKQYGEVSNSLRVERPTDETPLGGVEVNVPELSFIPLVLMGLIYLIIKRRKFFSKNKSAVILIGLLFTAISQLNAQTQCGFELVLESSIKPVCLNNGELKYRITNLNGITLDNIQYKIYLENEGPGSAQWVRNTGNSEILHLVGLFPGTHKIDAAALTACESSGTYFETSVTYTLERETAISDPNFTATNSRKTISCLPTGEITLRVTSSNNNGPFVFKVLQSPADYSGPEILHTSQSLAVGFTYTMDDLPPGDYRIELSDNCGAGRILDVTVDVLSTDFSALLYNKMVSPKSINNSFSTCDQLVLSLRNVNSQELQYYLSSDKRGEFYEYAFYLSGTIPADIPDSEWKDLPQEDYIIYQIPASSGSLENIRANQTALVPRIATRVKGAACTTINQALNFTISEPTITQTDVASGCFDRLYTFSTTSIICYPYTWKVEKIEEDNSTTFIDGSPEGSPVNDYDVKHEVLLSAGNYKVTFIDGDDYEFTTAVNFTSVSKTNEISLVQNVMTSGRDCQTYDYALFYLRGTNNTPMNGATIIYDKINSDPRIKYPVHDTLRLPANYKSGNEIFGWQNSVFPWSQDSSSYTFSMNPVEDFPKGAVFYFTVIDSCGIEKRLSGSRSYTYSEFGYVSDDVEPLFTEEVSDQCEEGWKMTITNIRDMMVRYQEKDYDNPIVESAYVWIDESTKPEGATVTYSRSSGYCMSNGDYIIVDKSGYYTFIVSAINGLNDSYCPRYFTRYIEVPKFGIDESRSVAYRCYNDDRYAYMLLRSANGSGNYSYELYSSGNMTPENLIDINSDGKFENILMEDNTSMLYLKVIDLTCGKFYTEVIQVWDLHSLTIAWTEETTRKCVGEPIYLYALNLGDEIDEDDNYIYTWTFPDGVTQSHVRNLVIEKADLSHSGTFKVEVLLKGCDIGEAVYAEIDISVASATMYWKKDAVNTDWHDANNWLVLDDQGNITTNSAIPAPCTTVHIPALSDRYPNLSICSTARSVWNPATNKFDNLDHPACDTIIYHYGSETVFPNFLQYNRAKVQYNFGYYDFDNKTYTIGQGNDAAVLPDNNIEETYPGMTLNSGEELPVLERAKWHQIASPLKYTLSGDYALAGFPKVYTHLYNTEYPTTGLPAHDDFTEGFRDLAVDLSDKGLAMALMVSDYYNSHGWIDHKNLEALKGIVEIPFYMDGNSDIMAYHLQEYDGTRSTLRYHNSNDGNMAPLDEYDYFDRDEKGYRFVFENDNDTVSIVNGIAVYEMPLKHINDDVASVYRRALVGNPLMCTIDFDMVYHNNKLTIGDCYWILGEDGINFDYYRVNDDGSDGGLGIYPSALSNKIKPLQAFIVQIKHKDDRDGDYLLLPLEEYNTVIVDDSDCFPRPVPESGKLPVEMRSSPKKGWVTVYGSTPSPNNSGDSIRIRSKVHFNSDLTDIEKLVYRGSFDKKAETFIVGTDGNLYSERVENDYPEKVRFGLESLYGDNITLYIQPGGNLITKAVLYDTETNTRLDVTDGGFYTFRHRVSRSESGVKGLDTERFELALEYDLSEDGISSDNLYLSVKADRSSLSIMAEKSIFSMDMVDMSGVPVIRAAGINSEVYEKYAEILPGMYLIKIKMATGETRTQKILVK